MDRKVHPMAVLAVIVVVALLIIGGPAFSYLRTSTSYNDGRSWALSNRDGSMSLLAIFPGCARKYMKSRDVAMVSSPVGDVLGDG